TANPGSLRPPHPRPVPPAGATAHRGRVGLVTVNWHDDRSNFWDTHGDNFNQLKNRLMPPADQGFAALLDDLDAWGLLGATLVVWGGEFGRPPRTNAATPGGEPWPRRYPAALAGGGFRGGQV